MLVTPCPSPLMTDVRPVNRVVGLETEYGALVHDAELSTEAWPARIKNYIFSRRVPVPSIYTTATTRNHPVMADSC